MRRMLPSTVYPSLFDRRIWSSAWSHGTSLSSTLTRPCTWGSMIMFSPLSLANTRSTARRSASSKSKLIGCPVYCFWPLPGTSDENVGGTGGCGGCGVTGGGGGCCCRGAGADGRTRAGALAAGGATGGAAGRAIAGLGQRRRRQPAVTGEGDGRGGAGVAGADVVEQRRRHRRRGRRGRRAGLRRHLGQRQVGAGHLRLGLELEADHVAGTPDLVGRRGREGDTHARDGTAVVGSGLLQSNAGDRPLAGQLVGDVRDADVSQIDLHGQQIGPADG